MKKTHLIWILLAFLALGAGICAFITVGNDVERIESLQQSVHEQYLQMRQNAALTDLTVTENGTIIGTYTLSQLGILQDTQNTIDACFDPLGRMDPAIFTNLSVREKLNWGSQTQQATHTAAANLDQLDLQPILQALNAMDRRAPENARVDFLDGAYVVQEEISGTVLIEAVVCETLTQSLTTLTIHDGYGSAAHMTVELTDADCYLPPEITMENANFDLDALLQNALRTMTVSVDFHGAKETLSTPQLTNLLSVSPEGVVEVDRTALQQIIADWAAAYNAVNTPYLLDSYIDGYKPIDFLIVDYEIDQESLLNLLCRELPSLQRLDLDAIWHCSRQNKPFTLGDTYVEVDMDNQVMTYFKNGKVLVSTDVVTGAAWGHMTPDGLYQAENKDTECWLSGPDYNVYVDYWVGFIEYTYGLHDADWRTEFGGDIYIKKGSHGCVNTPKEAMAVIFENIEVGTPVLVYGGYNVI